MERINELLDQLADELIKKYPNANTHNVYISGDGYIHIDSMKWDEGQAEIAKRRYEYSQSRYEGEWKSDGADGMNDYLKTVNKYLEDESNETMAS